MSSFEEARFAIDVFKNSSRAKEPDGRPCYAYQAGYFESLLYSMLGHADEQTRNIICQQLMDVKNYD